MENSELLQLLNDNYDVSFARVEFHRDGGSLSYIAMDAQNKYFLRVIRPELMETAYLSIDIHMYLLSVGFSVPQICLTRQRKPYIKIDNGDKANLYVLYEYIEGGEPAPEDIADIGKIIGSLHTVMANYPGELKHRDKEFFIDRYVNILKSKNHELNGDYERLGERLWDKVKNLPRGYCHCDLYTGNIHKSKEGKLYVLDFDTSCNAFPMFDITLFCGEIDYFEYSDEGFDQSKRQLAFFLEGYQKHRTLTKEEIESFYYFEVINHFQLQATIVEIYGIDCNEEDFEQKQLDWIVKWLQRAKQEITHDIV